MGAVYSSAEVLSGLTQCGLYCLVKLDCLIGMHGQDVASAWFPRSDYSDYSYS